MRSNLRDRIKTEQHFQRWRESSHLTMRVTKDKIKSHWGEFCKDAPIHGLRHLGEPKRPLMEKIWWLFVVLISMSYAIMYSWQEYQKLMNSPITEIPEDNYGNLTMIPFPAVTICDNRKSYFIPQGEDDSTTRNFREANLFICGHPHPLPQQMDTRRLLEMSPPLSQSCGLSNIYSNKSWRNCTAMFRRIVTDVGACHTFNIFSPSQIFTKGTEIEYEEHNMSSDWTAENRFTVTLYKKLLSGAVETLSCDSSDRLGFKIILHNPHEVPMIGHRRNIWSPTEFKETTIAQYFLLTMERKLELIVEPKLIRADEELSLLPADHRRCYFPGERQLSFFLHYSYSNCQLECVTNLTLNECNCADYYMPRVKGTKLCDRSHLGCISSVLEDWKRRGGNICNCLSSCNIIEYHAKTWYTYSPDPGEIVWNDTSLSVMMEDKVFLVAEKKPMYTKVDFYANCGGLFSLFCGMSIISIVEIVYHGSFRILGTLFYNWRHKDKN